MRAYRKDFALVLEAYDESPLDNYDESDVDDIDLEEVAMEATMLSQHFGQIADALEDLDALSDINEVVQDSVDAGEPLSPEAASMLQIGVESIYRRLGISHVNTICSMETFKYERTKMQSTRLALESGNSVIKGMIEFLKKHLTAIYEQFKNWIRKLVSGAMGYKLKIDKAVRKFEHAVREAKPGVEYTCDYPRLAELVKSENGDSITVIDVENTMRRSCRFANAIFNLAEFIFSQMNAVVQSLSKVKDIKNSSELKLFDLKDYEEKLNEKVKDLFFDGKTLSEEYTLAGNIYIDEVRINPELSVILQKKSISSNVAKVSFKKHVDRSAVEDLMSYATSNGKVTILGLCDRLKKLEESAIEKNTNIKAICNSMMAQLDETDNDATDAPDKKRYINNLTHFVVLRHQDLVYLTTAAANLLGYASETFSCYTAALLVCAQKTN
jgi:hypothetical protein